MKAVGGLIFARGTGRMLLLLRNEVSSSPLTWSMVAGHIEDNEDALTALKRETEEELGINSDLVDYYFIEKEDSGFDYYIGFTNLEFKCDLNSENLKYGWFDKEKLPTPLYPDLLRKINEI